MLSKYIVHATIQGNEIVYYCGVPEICYSANNLLRIIIIVKKSILTVMYIKKSNIYSIILCFSDI